MPAKGRRLGGSPAHQRHMLANLAAALFEHCNFTVDTPVAWFIGCPFLSILFLPLYLASRG